MITYRYCVHDEGGRILDKCFDDFDEAFDYAQDGLISYITESPIVDGIEDELESRIVWS